MSETLSLLLKISAIMISVNLINSIVLYFKTKNPYYKKYIALWLSSSLNFVLQGLFQENHFLLSLCMGISFFYIYIFVDILAKALKQKYDKGLYIGFYLSMNILSFIFYKLNASFTWVSAPIAISVAFPALHFVLIKLKYPTNKGWVVFTISSFLTVVLYFMDYKYELGLVLMLTSLIMSIYLALKENDKIKSKNKLRTEHKFYALSLLVLGFHYLDYPFLRMIPDAAMFGFSLALIMVLIFSYILNALVVIEDLVQSKEALEKEVISKMKELNIAKKENEQLLISLSDKYGGFINEENRGEVFKNIMKYISSYKGGDLNLIVNSQTGSVRLKDEQKEKSNSLELISGG